MTIRTSKRDNGYDGYLMIGGAKKYVANRPTRTAAERVCQQVAETMDFVEFEQAKQVVNDWRNTMSGIMIMAENMARKQEKKFTKQELQEYKEDPTGYVIPVICKFYNFNVDKLKERNKKKKYVTVRRAICYFMRKYGHVTYERIGSMIGVAHDTVIRHERRFIELSEVDSDFLQEANRVNNMILNHKNK